MDRAQAAPVVLRPRASLGRRMALLLLPLVLIPVVLIGATGYVRSRTILADQASAQLTSVTSSQVTRLLEWTEVREQRLQLGSQQSEVREPLAHLLHDNPGPNQRQEYIAALEPELDALRVSEGQTLFSHVMVVDPRDGSIIAGTREEWLGQTLPSDLLQELSMEQSSSLPLHNDPVLGPGTLSFISSVPMRTGMMEEVDAILLGVNLETRVGSLLDELQVFSEQRGFTREDTGETFAGVFREQTGETFLVMDPDLVIFQARYAIEPSVNPGSGHPVFDLRLRDQEGTAEYDSLAGVQVLSAYEWVPEIGLGVVTEVPTETVFSELNSLLPFVATLIVVTGVLTVLVAVYATSRMLRPLARLAEFAQRIARGEWDYRVPTEREDEIGVVGQALNRMAGQLRESYETLEQRVQDRTRQVRTASEVARAVTSIPSLEELLRQAVELIGERFGYYYVAIFLLDREGKFALLRQATGEVGEALIARGHKLAVGSSSIIGWVTANNQPRMASDVTEDPIHFRNELLPETRSEAAVPLQVGGNVLGALDVQSTEANAFEQEDFEVLQTLADQLSAAIQNARLAETSVVAAERARLISEVTGQMSGLLDVDQVLNTAAHSLHRALGDSEIMIRLTVPGSGDGQDTA